MSAPSVRGPARQLKGNLMIMNSNSAYSGIRLDLGSQEGNQHGTSKIMRVFGSLQKREYFAKTYHFEKASV
jgi:hypothetical protein